MLPCMNTAYVCWKTNALVFNYVVIADVINGRCRTLVTTRNGIPPSYAVYLHTKYFSRTLAQSISLEHLNKALHLNIRTVYFTRTLEQSTSPEHSHEELH
jgi:hypothetical protein